MLRKAQATSKASYCSVALALAGYALVLGAATAHNSCYAGTAGNQGTDASDSLSAPSKFASTSKPDSQARLQGHVRIYRVASPVAAVKLLEDIFQRVRNVPQVAMAVSAPKPQAQEILAQQGLQSPTNYPLAIRPQAKGKPMAQTGPSLQLVGGAGAGGGTADGASVSGAVRPRVSQTQLDRIAMEEAQKEQRFLRQTAPEPPSAPSSSPAGEREDAAAAAKPTGLWERNEAPKGWSDGHITHYEPQSQSQLASNADEYSGNQQVFKRDQEIKRNSNYAQQSLGKTIGRLYDFNKQLEEVQNTPPEQLINRLQQAQTKSAKELAYRKQRAGFADSDSLSKLESTIAQAPAAAPPSLAGARRPGDSLYALSAGAMMGTSQGVVASSSRARRMAPAKKSDLKAPSVHLNDFTAAAHGTGAGTVYGDEAAESGSGMHFDEKMKSLRQTLNNNSKDARNTRDVVAVLPPNVVTGIPLIRLGMSQIQANMAIQNMRVANLRRQKIEQWTVWTCDKPGTNGQPAIQLFLRNGFLDAMRVFDPNLIDPSFGITLNDSLPAVKEKFGEPAFILTEPQPGFGQNYIYPISQVGFHLARPAPGEQPRVVSMLIFNVK